LTFQFVTKINLPSPPAELIESAVRIMQNNNNTLNSNDFTAGQSPAESILVGNEIKNYGEHYFVVLPEQHQLWAKENIGSFLDNRTLKVGMTTRGDLWPHQDYQHNWSLNYVIDPGGTSVETYWAQEQGCSLIPEKRKSLSYWRLRTDLNLVHVEIIPVGQWVVIPTHIVHGTRGQTSDRISITVGIDEHIKELLFENKI
jgi:hypothetical protein